MQHVCRITGKSDIICAQKNFTTFFFVSSRWHARRKIRRKGISRFIRVVTKRIGRNYWWKGSHVAIRGDTCFVLSDLRTNECVKRTGPKLTRFVLFVNLKRSRFLERNGYVITCTWKRVIKNRNQKSRFADL